MHTVSTRASRYDIARRAAARIDTIEWEELPSLTGLLSKSLAAAGARHIAGQTEAGAFDSTSRFNVWTETMPSSLDQLEPSMPFRETIQGLITREVTEPDVFRQFFGSIAAVR
jgi:hypothetical protein